MCHKKGVEFVTIKIATIYYKRCIHNVHTCHVGNVILHISGQLRLKQIPSTSFSYCYLWLEWYIGQAKRIEINISVFYVHSGEELLFVFLDTLHHFRQCLSSSLRRYQTKTPCQRCSKFISIRTRYDNRGTWRLGRPMGHSKCTHDSMFISCRW